jgi:hypothetical protein
MTLFDAFSALNALIDTVRAAFAARDQVKLNEALADIQSNLIAANSATLQAMQRTLELEQALSEAQREIMKLHAAQEDAQHYELHALQSGALVYAYRPHGDGDRTPAHYLCQPCKDQGVKSVLRLHADGSASCPREPAHNIHGPGGPALAHPGFSPLRP